MRTRVSVGSEETVSKVNVQLLLSVGTGVVMLLVVTSVVRYPLAMPNAKGA